MREICIGWLYILLSVYHTSVICREMFFFKMQMSTTVRCPFWSGFWRSPSPTLTTQTTSWVSLSIWVWCLNCFKMQVGNNFSPEATKNTEDMTTMKISAYSWKAGFKTYNWHLLGGVFGVCMKFTLLPLIYILFQKK